jgi:hypothetical protein
MPEYVKKVAEIYEDVQQIIRVAGSQMVDASECCAATYVKTFSNFSEDVH